MKLKDVLSLQPTETNGGWAIKMNYRTTLIAYREMQYSMVITFMTIHGATKTDKRGLFPAGDVNRLLCADNFCYDTIYSIVMQDVCELRRVKGMGSARLGRILNIINDMAGFDIISTIADLKRYEYQEEIAHKIKMQQIEDYEAEYDDDLHAM